MIVYFSTVHRKRPVREGGELVALDWESKRVRAALPLCPTDPDIVDDPNPRGNSRGGKGILVRGSEILVGTYHTVLVLDRDLEETGRITNGLFVNLHEMWPAGEDLWVSSTTIDCALLVDGKGKTLRSWWPREEPLLQERFGISPLALDKDADNRLLHLHAELGQKKGHTHLNSVFGRSGETYALLNRYGAVVRIEPSVEVVIEDPSLKGAHSPVFCGEGPLLAVCCSFDRKVLLYDIDERRCVRSIDLLDFGEVAELHRRFPDEPFNKSIFVRGLEILDGRRFLVGISPASILEVDYIEGRLLDVYVHSSSVGDAVHGLAHVSEVDR